MKKLIFWEMNEINFDFVHYYISKGKLKNWKKFIDAHGISITNSEPVYENIEPWIQWPTIRTGLDYSEHKVFRLGDFGQADIKQHWEIIEDKGFSVAAISPINATNNTRNSPFWIPDPWIETKVSGGAFEKRLSQAIKQAVNDNAKEKLSLSTILALIESLITKSKLSRINFYARALLNAVIRGQHWSKAIILDKMISDVFISLWSKSKPDFSVLFLNGGAHIQHHYMFNSKAYKGAAKNPSWYVQQGLDPLMEVLDLYDSILQDLLSLPNTRLMIAVGMRQVPYEQNTYYWRLKNHADFLKKIGIEYRNVTPRMTRDFLIEFDSIANALIAVNTLSNIHTKCNGTKVFAEIDNRGLDVFVTLTYPFDIDSDMLIVVNDNKVLNLNNEIVFVAIKNGHHDQQGYFLDSEATFKDLTNPFNIKYIFSMIMRHFDIKAKNSMDNITV